MSVTMSWVLRFQEFQTFCYLDTALVSPSSHTQKSGNTSIIVRLRPNYFSTGAHLLLYHPYISTILYGKLNLGSKSSVFLVQK
jgi:hypothetical protein